MIENGSLRQTLVRHGMRFADLARLMNVDKATITRWSQKGIPAERAPEIERRTGIGRHELRPDLWNSPDEAA